MAELLDALSASSASPAFRAAVRDFVSTGAPGDLIRFEPGAPIVKIERTLTMILRSYPQSEIASVRIDGRSGCEFFRGTTSIQTPSGVRTVEFHWDCRWRAMEAGWTDYFGFPDQLRAAREFGYDCFRIWTEVPAPDQTEDAA